MTFYITQNDLLNAFLKYHNIKDFNEIELIFEYGTSLDGGCINKKKKFTTYDGQWVSYEKGA